MFEKLGEISKILLLPAVALYAFGFFTVNAYLAQFGMITFDILNARFLIAGIITAIPFSIILLFAWHLHKAIPFKDILKANTFRNRFANYFIFLLTVSATSAVTTSVLNMGSPTSVSSQATLNDLKFQPFLKFFLHQFDVMGNIILAYSHLLNKIGPALTFVFQYSLYVSFYVLLGYLILFIGFSLYQKFRGKTNKSEVSPNSNPQTEGGGDKKEVKEINITNNFAIFCIRCVDIFFVILFLVLLIYCVEKLNLNVFNFELINSNLKLSSSLVYAWMYFSILSIYIFLNTFNFPSEQLSINFDWANWFKQFLDLENLRAALQQLFIPTISCLFFFGTVIFPRIPFAIGGGFPREITINTTPANPIFETGRFYLLEETNSFLFILKTNEATFSAIEVNKNTVNFIETGVATSSQYLNP